jgi:hypothetical protein
LGGSRSRRGLALVELFVEQRHHAVWRFLGASVTEVTTQQEPPVQPDKAAPLLAPGMRQGPPKASRLRSDARWWVGADSTEPCR